MKSAFTRQLSVVALTIIVMAVFPSISAAGEAPAPTVTREMIHVYGRASVDGGNVPVGSLVKAYDPDGTICGQYEVTARGYFGLMNIFADDRTTRGIDEGARPGDRLCFFIDGVPATVLNEEPVLFTKDGAVLKVDLQIGAPDTTAPAVTGAKALSPIHLSVTFSESVDDTTGSDTAHYAIRDAEDNEIKIYKATVQKKPETVVLNTDALQKNVTYFLTVNKDITDLWGNTMEIDQELSFLLNVE